MYRDYEDPRALQAALRVAYAHHEQLERDHPEDLEALMVSEMDIHELESRLDAAWSDEEADLYG